MSTPNSELAMETNNTVRRQSPFRHERIRAGGPWWTDAMVLEATRQETWRRDRGSRLHERS